MKYCGSDMVGRHRLSQRPPAPKPQSPSDCFRTFEHLKKCPFLLSFPCFSPLLLKFCSASLPLRPSELREGWCVFNLFQHDTTCDLCATAEADSRSTFVFVRYSFRVLSCSLLRCACLMCVRVCGGGALVRPFKPPCDV